uniref:Secreted protein n=1 Tax=Steinernema glaseri TaxID=37863 RepID=A0A1I8A6V6_9BILA
MQHNAVWVDTCTQAAVEIFCYHVCMNVTAASKHASCSEFAICDFFRVSKKVCCEMGMRHSQTIATAPDTSAFNSLAVAIVFFFVSTDTTWS